MLQEVSSLNRSTLEKLRFKSDTSLAIVTKNNSSLVSISYAYTATVHESLGITDYLETCCSAWLFFDVRLVSWLGKYQIKN